MDKDGKKASRTAGEAGWHVSQYNLMAPVPGSRNVAIANLFRGTCAEYTPLECYLLSVVEELDERHPIIKRLFSGRQCVAFKDESERYVLALHARIGEKGQRPYPLPPVI